MLKVIFQAGISLAALAAASGAAHAQHLLPSGATASNVITFGDSLSDGGNFKAQNPGAAFNAPYLGGATFLNGAPNPLPLNLNRFTNGLTWAETLAAQTGAGAPVLFGGGAVAAGANANYAFGASRSDAIPALVGTGATLGPALGIQGVIASPTAVGATAPIGGGATFGITTVPGLPQQIAAYGANGGTFGPNSLVTIWSGANDIFQISSGYPAGATPTQIIQGAAVNVGTAVGQVMALGARNIIVNNLPDLGATPSSITGGAAAIAQGTAAANGYNAALTFALSGAAAAAPAGTNIILVDVNKAFAAVTANPAAYGFTNVTAACVTTPACIGGGAAAQAGYLFWDTVHPTAAGHALVARLAQAYLAATGATPAYGRLLA
ncbi:MAG: SGNH/GDSL hydrolase family protein, partial [Beijerinckiaceae bacterium]